MLYIYTYRSHSIDGIINYSIELRPENFHGIHGLNILTFRLLKCCLCSVSLNMYRAFIMIITGRRNWLIHLYISKCQRLWNSLLGIIYNCLNMFHNCVVLYQNKHSIWTALYSYGTSFNIIIFIRDNLITP